MCLVAKINGLGILVNGGVEDWVMIAGEEGCPAAMSAADFEDIFPIQGPGPSDMMLELNGGAIDFILRVKREGFAFRRPVAVIEEGDGVSTDSSAEVLIPMFPECLSKRWHGHSYR